MKTTDNGQNYMDTQQTVAELVLRHPQIRERLEQLGIDYCCGGKRTLSDAVKHAGLDPASVVIDLQQHLRQAHAEAAARTDWAAAPITVLADHILDTHHVFTKAQLSRIDMLLSRVQAAHAAAHGDMLSRLRHVFDALRDELESHLMKEEEILFPAIKGIDGYLAGTGAKPVVHCGSVAHPIRQMEHEHDGAGDALATIRRLTGGYRPPEDACPTFKALYEALQALESDLHEHIHLENNILFPASIKQERQMNGETL